MTNAIILANVRTGGTFLSHALSSHPQIFCDRGEPLHEQSPWWDVIGDQTAILSLIFNQQGYRARVCKLQLLQAQYKHVDHMLHKYKAKIIHLSRYNTLRQAVSLWLTRLDKYQKIERPKHSFMTSEPVQIRIKPDDFLNQCRALVSVDRRIREWLQSINLPVIELSYTDLVGEEGNEALFIPDKITRQLCSFLEVDLRPLTAELRKVNTQPLSEILVNWHQVRQAIIRSEFAPLLKCPSVERKDD